MTARPMSTWSATSTSSSTPWCARIVTSASLTHAGDGCGAEGSGATVLCRPPQERPQGVASSRVVPPDMRQTTYPLIDSLLEETDLSALTSTQLRHNALLLMFDASIDDRRAGVGRAEQAAGASCTPARLLSFMRTAIPRRLRGHHGEPLCMRAREWQSGCCLREVGCWSQGWVCVTDRAAGGACQQRSSSSFRCTSDHCAPRTHVTYPSSCPRRRPRSGPQRAFTMRM